MSYEVKVEWVDDEYGGCYELCITHNGELLAAYTDHGEPEDNSFGRDYKWIAKELLRAYELGAASK